MGKIQATMANFHLQCDEWEHELDQLLVEIESIQGASGTSVVPANQDLEVDSVRSELACIRTVVERQAELFAALMEERQLETSRHRETTPRDQDQVAAAVLDQLESLRQG